MQGESLLLSPFTFSFCYEKENQEKIVWNCVGEVWGEKLVKKNLTLEYYSIASSRRSLRWTTNSLAFMYLSSISLSLLLSLMSYGITFFLLMLGIVVVIWCGPFIIIWNVVKNGNCFDLKLLTANFFCQHSNFTVAMAIGDSNGKGKNRQQ